MIEIMKKSDVDVANIIQSIKDGIGKSKTDPSYRDENKMIIFDSLGTLNDKKDKGEI